MAVNVSATRTSTLFTDDDGDGIFDPDDTILVRIRVTNTGSDPATGVSVTDTLSGITLVPGSVQVTPIAYDDAFNLTGNTPITISAGQGLLLNDVDPDGAGGNAGLTVVSIDTTGTQGAVAFNANGSFTFTPTTGFVGVTAFKYFVQDAQGLGNVTEGIVTMTVTGLVWYVDNTYGGENGGPDGSYLKPFTSLNPLNDNGTGAGGTPGTADAIIGDDDVDGAGDTIFVYNNGGSYTAGITLEAGQTLRGDGVNFLVNGHNIGGTERTGGVDNVTTNAVISQASGTIVTLATDNTIRGIDISMGGAGVTGLADGGGSVTTSGGTFTMNSASITGTGKAVDIDQGGNLAVALTTLSSQNSSDVGVQLAGTAGSGTGLISGSFTATGGTIQTASSHNFQIGSGSANSGGTIAVDYDGALNTAINGSAVHITNRLSGSGDIRFDGAIVQDSGASSTSAGISINGVAAGNIFFTGTKTIDTVGGAQNAIEILNNSGAVINFSGGALNLDTDSGHGFAISQSGGQVNVSVAADIDTASGRGISISGSTGGSTNFTGGGLTITTSTGDALHSNNASSGSSLTITGSGNTLNTTTGGQLVDISNTGTSAITFDTMTAGANVSDDAIFINNLDGGTWTTTTITVRTTGAGNDGILIQGGSSTNFSLGTVNVVTAGDDGIELNGAGGNPVGTVTATSVVINNTGGDGLEINTYNNTVTVSGGTIGNTDDPAGDGVNITGGTGAVTIAAAITKTTAGNVVEVENHETGNVTFSGALSATGGVNNGILVNNVNTGTIAFNGQTNISTGTNVGVNLTNNGGGTIAFNAGGNGLDITTTSGTGFNATGGGTVTVQGSGNTITAVGGMALNINNTNIGANDVTFESISANGGSYGIRLNTTGSAGGLHVTGTGSTNASGGTIQNIGTRGIEAISTSELTLSNMALTNANNSADTAGNDLSLTGANAALWMQTVTGVALNNIDISGTILDNGIVGIGVSNFVMDNSTITNAGNGAHESGIEFSNLSGTSSISNTSITFSQTNGLDIVNTDVNLTLTLNNVSFTDTQRVSSGGAVNLDGQGGFQFRSFSVAGGSPVTDINILDSDFDRNRTQGIQIVGEDDSTVNVDITSNNIRANHLEADTTIGIGAGIDINGNDTSTVTFNVINNLIQTRNGIGVNITSFLDANVEGRVNNNNITANGIAEGIRFLAEATSNMIVEARNNLVTMGAGNSANGSIHAIARVGSSRLDVTIDNNTIDSDPLTLADIRLQSGSSVAGETNQLFANVINNDVVAGGPTNKWQIRVSDLDASTDPRVFLTGFVEGGPGIEDDAVATWNANANTPAVTTATVSVSLSATATGPSAGTALVPDNPAAAMVAAPPAPPADDGIDQTSSQGGESGEPAGDGGGDPVSGGGGGGGDTGGVDQTGGQGGETGEPSGDGGDPPPAIVDDGIISQDELAAIVEAAIQRWIDAGASAGQVAAMRATSVSVIDMAGLYVGSSSTGTILIDSDGAGYGWFVDMTPLEDSEFEGTGTRLTADAGGAAEGRIDLLTVIMHELGHQIGLGDTYHNGESDELMFGYMSPGVRRLPGDDDHVGAVPGSVGQTAFALTPVSVGTIPTNKTVDVFFKATIDSQSNGLITNLNNTSTISGNFTDVNANEVNALDTLTLGNTIYIDANNDGNFDAGEGVSGVTLTLYADANGNGVLDGAELTTVITTTTSGAGGAYSFTGLAPGNYVVSVDAANFTGGGALVGKINTAGGTDPDDNVDNDDNGIAGPGGTVISNPITLSYNNEGPSFTPGAGVSGEDTNNTLDFGFVDINDPPTLTATGQNPTYVEGAAAADLYSTVTASTVEAGQALTSMTLTVTNVTDGSAEVLTFDGSDVALTHANAVTTATNGLNVNVSLSGTTATVSFAGASLTPAQIQTLVDALAYRNTSQNPTDANRVVTITELVDSGGNVSPDDNSATLSLVSTVNVDPVNDEPAGTDATLTAVVNANFVLASSHFGFTDGDGNAFLSVFIDGVTGGKLLVDADLDGFEPSDEVTTFPQELTVAFIDNGRVAFVPDTIGSGTGSVSFRVRDDGGTANLGEDTDQSANTLTFDVTPPNSIPAIDLDANDSVAAGTSFTTSYSEGNATGVLIADSDVLITDADAGDMIESATIAIQGPLAGDQLTLGAQAGFTVNGSGTGTITITGTGTAADYEAMIEQVRYLNSGDNPTNFGAQTTRTIHTIVNDGSDPSAPAVTTVNITGINDAPVNSLGGTIGTGEDAIDAWLSGMAIADPDAAPATHDIVVTFDVDNGTLDIRTDVVGGLTAGDVTGDDTATITVTGTLNEINATLAASNGLTYSPTLNFNGNDTLTVTTNDQGNTGADPGLTGDASSEEATTTRTIQVSAVNDVPIITGDVTGDVTEAGGVNNGTPGTPTDTGDLNSDDVDNPDDSWFTAAPGSASFNGYGTYAVTAAGVWTYTLDDNNAAVQALNGAATLTDGFNVVTVDGTAVGVSITIHAQDDAGTAQNDSFNTDEATAIANGSLVANDTDVDGGTIVTAVNGSGANVGGQITLSSGALLTVNSNGTFDYDPNNAFNTTPAPGSGASNRPAHDSFTYTVGGTTATVTLNVDGLDTNDFLFGTAAVDTLSAGAGVDVLNGLGGADTMIGGSGNDSYVADVAGDIVIEGAGGGFDAIYSHVNYVLAEGQEIEGLSTILWEASTPINLTGNSINNYLIGNEGSNTLNGGAGNDALEGRGGNDNYVVDSFRDRIIELVGGGGFDAAYTSVDYKLAEDTYVEGLAALVPSSAATINLTGNFLNNYIVGNAGTGAIDGGGGNDTMEGLGGNDFYVVDTAGDVVIEAAGGGGFDAVYTSVSYTLTAGQEIEGLGTLNPAATTAINLTGNGLANYLAGNAGANTLDGKGGNDALEGNAGIDTYAFTTALGVGNVDRIYGFVSGTDKIALDDAIFTGLIGGGGLPPGAFNTGSSASEADDRILYDPTTGALYFDQDGSGGAFAAVHFATVQGAPLVAAGDFTVI